MKKEELNKLKERLHYEKETGIFLWSNPITNSLKSGDIAGTKNKEGYIKININNKIYSAHRLAWLYFYEKFPKNYIDHINGIKNDNRICNLRDVTSKESAKNKSIRNNNTSGFTGVSFSKANKKWKAQICIKGKQTNLGYFKNKEDAIKRRKLANIKYGYHENHGRKK